MHRRTFLLTSAAALAAPSLIRAESSPVTLFHGGTVLPVDEAFSRQSALVMRGADIIGVGTYDDMAALAGDGATVIDLQGRTLMPGFIEPHMHLTLIAAFGPYADVGPFVNPTFEDSLSALRKAHDEIEDPNAWLVARQFDPSLLEPSRELTVVELDKIAPNRPAFVLNASGHIAYVNSKALEFAGITQDVKNGFGGSYGRLKDGTLSGVIYGTGAFLPIVLKIPAIQNALGDGLAGAVMRVGDTAAAMGITTMCDMAAGAISGLNELEVLGGLYGEAGMKARVRSFIYDPGTIKPDQIKPFHGSDFARVAGWKVIADGSNQGFTGRQREPYHTDLTLGLHYIQPEDLIDKIATLSELGWSIAMHGNGNAAIDSILNAVEFGQRRGIDMSALRHRIEHASILHDEQIARMVKLGVSPSFLINHVHYWGHAMRDKVFGPEKVMLLDRCASVEKAGLIWTNHSDAPVSPFGALHKIRVAAVRDLWKEPQTILNPDERVSVQAAIRAVTRNAAWQCHSEDLIGSLEPGKRADMVLLEEDLTEIDPVKISDIKVSETWMDGQKVFG